MNILSFILPKMTRDGIPLARPNIIEAIVWGFLFVAITLFSGVALAVVHATTLTMLIYLGRQTLGLRSMHQELTHSPLQANSWGQQGFREALKKVHINQRTDNADLRLAIQQQYELFRWQLSWRWWICTTVAFAMPLLGLFSGWARVAQYGQLLTLWQTYGVLLLAWVQATIVISLTCLLYFYGEYILGQWMLYAKLNADLDSSQVQEILVSPEEAIKANDSAISLPLPNESEADTTQVEPQLHAEPQFPKRSEPT
jgi:hypothetical protein